VALHLLALYLAQARGTLSEAEIRRHIEELLQIPQIIEQVLVKDAKHYIKHFGARAFKPVLGNGLVTSEGAYWQRQRKLVQPAFLKSRVHSYAPVMAELTEEMLQSWAPGESVRINFEFETLTSKIALKALFGLDDDADRALQRHAALCIRRDCAARGSLRFRFGCPHRRTCA
jgi:cytochrome P450